MFGIDTNVLLRFFAPLENPVQTAAVHEFVRTHSPVLVSSVVLAEFVWTLRRSFGFGHDAISNLLSHIIAAPEFALADLAATERAVEQYKNGAADFADYLIGELNRSAGRHTTMTFDQTAAKTSEFKLLKPEINPCQPE